MVLALFLVGVQVVCVVAAFASDSKSKTGKDDGPGDPGHYCS